MDDEELTLTELRIEVEPKGRQISLVLCTDTGRSIECPLNGAALFDLKAKIERLATRFPDLEAWVPFGVNPNN